MAQLLFNNGDIGVNSLKNRRGVIIAVGGILGKVHIDQAGLLYYHGRLRLTVKS